MTEADKRAAINRYFAPFPKWAIWLIAIGVPAIGAYGLGLLMIGGGAWAIYNWSQRPTDQQMDGWIEEDITGLQEKALKRSGHDNSELVSEPAIITGPKLWDVGNAEIGHRKGQDNTLRFTPLSVTVLNFTQTHLSSYQAVLDLRTGNTLNEATDEFFYRHIVSAATKSDSFNVTFGGESLQLKTADSFELTTAGGNSIKVFLRDPVLIQKLGGGNIPTTRADRALATVRKMLREKAG